MSYLDAEGRPYIHLVDGGIAGNLGLRATLDRLIVLGGAQKVASYLGAPIPNSIVFILVNADTKPTRPFGLSPDEPSLGDVVDAVSDIQIKRYNIETLALMRKESKKVARELGAVNENTEVYFIEVSFEALKDEKERLFFNNIKTTLALEPDEIRRLREAGRRLFFESPEFKRLQADLNSGKSSGQSRNQYTDP